jgi:hypothetical protein
MMRLVEPLGKLILNGIGYSGEGVEEGLFGGFCHCGGVMYQKFWFKTDNESILVSECEKCWKHKAMIFNSTSFVGCEDVEVLGRYEFVEFLKEVLSEKEFEALVRKANGDEFNSIAYSNAKKKLKELNIDPSEVQNLIK